MNITPPLTEGAGAAHDGVVVVDAAARAAGRRARLARSRTLTLFGGLVLFTAFFLPAIDSCGKAIYPAAELLDDAKNWSGNPLDLAGMFSMYAGPYAFGLLVALGALFVLRGRVRAAAWCDWLATGIIGFVCVTAIVGFGMDLDLDAVTNPTLSADWPSTILVSALFLGLICWLFALRKGEAGRVSARWIGGLLGMVWFGCWVFGGGTYFGLWLSILGAGLIAAGALGEAMVRARLSAWSAVLQLAPCRLRFRPIEDNLCNRCGYLPIGLPTRRCPECGEAF